jgi:site-specific DNA-methyltransferase (adenine-specific)
MNSIFHGDCLQVLPTFQANTFDSLVTDPPASISFMEQAWDADRGGRRQWVSWLSQVMREALRVLKPGAHGLVWAIPRRSHWTALALEDAGYEIRDCLCHYFLSGFPKSLNVGKGIDKKIGVKRQVVGSRSAADIRQGNYVGSPKAMTYEYTSAASPEAKQWEGWGTHLKPAIELWWLVRKPLAEKTVAANVLKWGTGALNIDGSRIPVHQPKGNPSEAAGGWERSYKAKGTRPGVFAGVPNNRGQPRPADLHPDTRYPSHFLVSDWELLGDHTGFFLPPIYCPKARKCRGEGNHHPTVKPVELLKYFITLLTRPGGHVLDCLAGSFSTGVAAQELGCAFTGIEMDSKYVQIGVRRLSA